ncbi:sugar phosphate isomerase/epimerase family protein [Cohnella sp. GCM10012308]|uniref:sugar phosphate isomerase/epimerase family protein n=1 Tax=Cohnella sp. GCM10012308 TaxID=3317329 RepID=UPI00360A9526
MRKGNDGKPRLAVQLYTLHDRMAADLEGTLQAVREIGYDGIEWAGLHGRSPEEAGHIARRLGLDSAGMHVGADRLFEELPALIEEARLLETRHIVCSAMPERLRHPDGYREFRRRIGIVASALAAEGLTIGYHNHDFELRETIEGITALAYLLAPDADNALLAEPDVYWLVRAGVDPLTFLQPYAGRVPTIHFKDMAADESRGFAPVGTGSIAFEPIVRWCERHDVEWLIVEQDECRTDPIACIRTSLTNLRTMEATIR